MSKKKKVKSKKGATRLQEKISPEAEVNKGDKWSFVHSRWFEIAALALVVALGLLVRLEDVRDWKAHPELALYKGEPLLTTFDGYFYLRLARDLAEGVYEPVDGDRAVPDRPKRPWPPPLLSVLGAAAAKVTPWSINWIGAVLPCLLGILLALPLYSLGRFYGGPVMGLTAVLMGLLSHYYVYRSSLGWFDTDCMNVTWGTGVTFAFLLFAVNKAKRRYLYFGLGIFLYALFLWWWDSTPAVTTVISFVPFAVALIFFYRPKPKEGMIFGACMALAGVAVLMWQGFDLPVRIVQQVLSVFQYISTKKAAGIWPSMGATISEQAIPTFSEIVAKTTDSLPAFILAAVGLAWLFVKKPKDSLFLSVPIILAALAFFFAKRFLVFLAPVTALGIGFAVSELWRLRSKYRLCALAVPVLVFATAWFPFKKDMGKNFWPKEPPHLVEGMDFAGKATPENAVIWAWWDHGYPMQYWARRGVISDGTFHDEERSVYNGFPYVAHSYRLAANFINFYVARGKPGFRTFYKAVGNDPAKGLKRIKEILAAGPEKGRTILENIKPEPVREYKTTEDWLRFFFPGETRPAYIFLDWRLLGTSYWWYWLGSWDIEKREGIHPFFKPLFGVIVKGTTATDGGRFNADLVKGIAQFGGVKFPIKKAYVHDGRRIRSNDFPYKEGLNFELFVPGGFAALEDQNISESVFNKLFMRHMAPSIYFQPVALKAPSFQLWKVKGDTF